MVASAGVLLSLTTAPLQAQSQPSDDALAASRPVAASVPGGRVRVVLKGKRLGKKARVEVRGVKGKAKGWKATVRVKKSKTVKKVAKKGKTAQPLPPGRYVVIGKKITTDADVARAKRKKVKVSQDRGARAVLRYIAETASSEEPVDPDAPQPSPPVVDLPPDDQPPGAVTGLTTGKITGTTIKLQWTLPADPDLDRIVVRRAMGTTPPAGVNDGQGVPLPFKAADFATDEGLEPGSEYSYAVFAQDATGNTSDAASVTASTPPRDILAEAVTYGNAPIARVVDEDGSGTINADDVVLLGRAPTALDAPSTTPLGAGPLTVLQAVTQTSEDCSFTHSGDPAKVMTFSTAGNLETWRDAGPANATEITDSLSAASNDFIAMALNSPTAPGVVVDPIRTSPGDDDFIDVATFCSSSD
jgi:hypothetical protein